MRSMTAYASVYKRKNSQSLQIILRSSNFKYLEINIKNSILNDIILEEKIRTEIQKKIFRGKIEVFILPKEKTQPRIYFEEENLLRYIKEAKKVAKKYNLDSRISIGEILNLPYVVSFKEKDINLNFIFSIFKEVFQKFLFFKEKAGNIIRKNMIKNLNKLKENISKIKLNKSKTVNEESKEDIEEEISLISFYINRLENCINSKKMVVKGKSINFLTQEILRELNSSSSKTKEKALAYLIVEAKNHLERIREQAQNIE